MNFSHSVFPKTWIWEGKCHECREFTKWKGYESGPGIVPCCYWCGLPMTNSIRVGQMVEARLLGKAD